MKLIFENSSEDFDQHKQLALELNFEIVDVKQIDEIKSYKDTYFFVISDDRLFIKKGLNKNTKPIFSDFDTWLDNYDDKLLQNCLKTLPKNFNCLDLTAGFAKDAFEISKDIKCSSVHLVEKELWLFKLIENGIDRASQKDTNNLLSKFRLTCQDNLSFLTNYSRKVDLIYIDPMFSGVQKALAKRHMQALRDLTSCESYEGLLEASLEKASDRVIVKRHKNMSYLDGISPTRSVEGKVIRYDIYSTK